MGNIRESNIQNGTDFEKIQNSLEIMNSYDQRFWSSELTFAFGVNNRLPFSSVSKREEVNEIFRLFDPSLTADIPSLNPLRTTNLDAYYSQILNIVKTPMSACLDQSFKTTIFDECMAPYTWHVIIVFLLIWGDKRTKETFCKRSIWTVLTNCTLFCCWGPCWKCKRLLGYLEHLRCH